MREDRAPVRGDLRARLRAAAIPGEETAHDRAWRVVEAAYADRVPARRRPARRLSLALVAAAGVAAVGAGVALTPPGEAVGEWVRHIVQAPERPHGRVRPLLGPLPGRGRLLVTAPSGAWILQSDGTRRRLGAYEHATFSPRGLYVAVTRGSMLAAVDPLGRVHWTLTRPRRVTAPSWSPDGFRVAYRSGRELRVVYGDGALDRRVARRSAPVRPAWWPGPAHLLAYAQAGGHSIALRDADTGRRLWRASAGGRVIQLAWAPDGRRLLAVTPAAIRVLGTGGHVARIVRAPAGMRIRRVAWLPGGHGFAILRTSRTGTTSEVTLAGASTRADRRPLLAVPGLLTEMLASPDGSRLLLADPAAGQWLLVRTSGAKSLTAFSRVGRQFDPGGRGRPTLPSLAGWIR